MRPKVILLALLAGAFLSCGVGIWFVYSRFLVPKTELYGILVKPKIVDFTKIPWRYAGPGNVFEVPKMDVQEIASLLSRQGFKDRGPDTSHAFSSSPSGPFIYVDSRDFEKELPAGHTEIISIMKCQGTEALVHYELMDPQQ